MITRTHSEPIPVLSEQSTVINWQQVKDQWTAVRPSIASYWSRLPADEIASLGGDRASLVDLVRRIYALSSSGAENQVDAWVAGLSLATASPAASPPAAAPPPATTKEQQRAEGEGMGVVPGAASPPKG
jgi:hypothetical protein